MADKPANKGLLPGLLAQNPAPVHPEQKLMGTQEHKQKVRDQVDNIMKVFLQLLPSNYISQVTGPFYTLQFQAAAEQIAEFQVTAQEAWADGLYDYTRSEFLFQVLGQLVFPDAQTNGYPDIQGDLTYRQFLQAMVRFLLQGATKSTIQESLAEVGKATQGLARCENPDLVQDIAFAVIEKGVEARKLGSGSVWGLDDQFCFEVSANYTDATSGLERFPESPFALAENVRLVMRALKPAHTLYEYRHLFTETFETLFSESQRWEMHSYYYDDFRRYCQGAKRVTGTAGETLMDRSLFRDVGRDFSNISVGAPLVVTSGPNGIHAGGLEGTTASTDRQELGRYAVAERLTFPGGDDSAARPYTTSPTGLMGTATVNGSDIIDASQNWALAAEGEVLTFTEGPNAGSYRLKTVLGSAGGRVGFAAGPATGVRIAPSILRLETRMPESVAGQSYYVEVDRLGEQEPKGIESEDVSNQFFL